MIVRRRTPPRSAVRPALAVVLGLAFVGIGIVLILTGSGVATSTEGVETDCSTAPYALVVADMEDEPLLTVPVENGSNVTLSYVHSVENTSVLDVYAVEDESLTMVKMEFDSFGAGLPSTADVERTDRGSLVTYLNETFEELYVNPGSIAGHTLVVDGERYDLVSLSGGETVRLSVVRGGGVDCENSTFESAAWVTGPDRS